MSHGGADRRRAIERTLINYCDAVDRGDIDRVVGRFTPDASVDYGIRTQATGRVAIAALFEGLRTTARATSHRLTNVVIDVDGTAAASATSYVTAWHELVQPAGRQLVIHGRYRDRLRNVAGDWLIEERRLEVHGASAPVPFHMVDRRPPDRTT